MSLWERTVDSFYEFRAWVVDKFLNIAVLYFVLSILTVLGFAWANYYDVFKGNTIIIENAHAAGKEDGETELSVVDCESAISVSSKQYQISRDLMVRIMDAESGNKHTAANKESTARGCFQFILGTWELYGKRHWGEDFYNKNIYSPKDNVELAAWAMSEYGTSDWDASKHIWGK